jgi:hypothetical protein
MRGDFMRLTIIILFSLLCLQPATALEQDKPLPDRWHGMILNQTSPDDAIKALGAPSKDSITSLSVSPLDQWVTKKRKQKIFRTLEYKKPIAGVEKAWLAFLDHKLVSILLDMKEGTVSPNGLSAIYGIEFTPMIGAGDLAFSPKDYECNQGKIYPKTYPTVYHLTAMSETSFVCAMIGNVPSFGGAFAKSMGVPDKPSSFPGKVSLIQLINRTLENVDGADVLK